MQKINKNKLTSLEGLRPGNMVTRDWQKPTQQALTVIEVKLPEYVLFENSRGESLYVTERTLSNYDISVAEGSPHAR